MTHDRVTATESIGYLAKIKENLKDIYNLYKDKSRGDTVAANKVRREMQLVILAMDMLTLCSDHCIEDDDDLLEALDKLEGYENEFEIDTDNELFLDEECVEVLG